MAIACGAGGTPDELSRLIDKLFVNPDIEQIRLNDPRFRWLRKRVSDEARRATTLRDLIDTLTPDSSDHLPRVASLLQQLVEFTTDASNLVLEDELFDILTPVLNAKYVEAMLGRFGWSGAAPTTLERTGEVVGVTRERIRQVQQRTETILGGHSVWTPVLDRALAVIRRNAPLATDDVGYVLRQAGLVRAETFSAEGLLKAQTVFRRDRGLRIVYWNEVGWVICEDSESALEMTAASAAVWLHARKLVSRHGIGAITELRAQLAREVVKLEADRLYALLRKLPSIQILHGTWIVPVDHELRNPLVNRLNKLLCVCPSIPVDYAVRQIQRDEREERRINVDDEMLRAFVMYRPEYDLRDDRISARGAIPPEDALSDAELSFLRLWSRKRRPLRYPEISEAEELSALSKPAINLLLRYSPIVDRHNTRGHYEYTLTGARDDGADTEGDGDLRAELGAVAEDVIPAIEAPEAATQESPEVRQGIHAAFRTLQKGRGLVPAGDLIAHLRELGRVQLSQRRLSETIKRIDGLVELPSGWIACIGSESEDLLARRLRKLLAVYQGIPVDVARIQLMRENPLYGDVPLDVVREYIAVHPEFNLDGDRIYSSGARSGARSVLSRGEYLVREALVDARRALSPGEVPGYIRGRAKVPEKDIHCIFRESCVLVPDGSGRCRALQPLEPINDLIRRRCTSVSAPASIRPTANELMAIPVPQSDSSPNGSIVPAEVTPAPGLLSSDDCDPSDAAAETARGWTETRLVPIGDLLEQVEENRLRLPEIQRGYVWKAPQVRDLFDSLYRGYPIGTMLVWQTVVVPPSRALGEPVGTSHGARTPESAYLLDGQQRLTSLSKVIRSGDIRLMFNPQRQVFEVANALNSRSPFFIPVIDLFRRGAAQLVDTALQWKDDPNRDEIYARLRRLESITQRIVPVQVLHLFSYEDVTEIFVRVNSRGTRLKTAELAIAQLVHRLPGMVSDELARYAGALEERGWDFDIQFLMRTLTAIAAGRSSFKVLRGLSDGEMYDAWQRLVPAMDRWLDLLGERLGIRSVNLIPSVTNHVVPIAWLAMRHDQAHESRLLEWYIHSLTWGRYTGATETSLDQDLRVIRSSRDPFRALMDRLRTGRPQLRVTLRDLERASSTSSFALLAFLATRRANGVDLFTGEPINATTLASREGVIMQPLFPSRAIGHHATGTAAKDLANHVFLWQDPLGTLPSRDLYRFLTNVPHERLQGQSIPTDASLWTASRFSNFIQQRRRLLVEAMNAVLAELSQPGAEETGGGAQGIWTGGISQPAISVEDWFDEPYRSTFLRMREAILGIEEGVVERPRQVYISYEVPGPKGRSFATLANRRTTLIWTLNVSIDQLDDPKGWCRDVTHIGKHGIGDTQFRMDHQSEIEYAMHLIGQAYQSIRHARSSASLSIRF